MEYAPAPEISIRNSKTECASIEKNVITKIKFTEVASCGIKNELKITNNYLIVSKYIHFILKKPFKYFFFAIKF